jgi:hypothetical protein
MQRFSRTGIGVLLFAAVPGAVAAAQPQWRLVEDLRIGSEASDKTIFADIRGIVEGTDGKIFVLDIGAGEMRVFDRSGKFLSVVARRGRGPGEIGTIATGMLVLNGVIWVNDESNQRLPGYSTTDGKYLRQITIPISRGRPKWEAGTDAEGRIVAPIALRTNRVDAVTGRVLSEQRVRRIRTDGSGADTIAGFDCAQRNPPARTSVLPFEVVPVVAIDGRGGYWCAPNDEYVLIHRSLGTNATRETVRMPYARLPIAPEERARRIESRKQSNLDHGISGIDYSLTPREYPMFERLDVDDTGRLWAMRATRAGTAETFDLYDATGRPLATIRTTLPFDPIRPLHIKGDYVFGVVRDADDVSHVVRARIVRQ